MTRLPPTVAERIAILRSRFPRGPASTQRLDPPAYIQNTRPARTFCAVETFARHMTDEGWQLQLGLQAAGYGFYGRYFDRDMTDCREIIRDASPGVLIMQDKREWDSTRDGCFDKSVGFENYTALADQPNIFRLTVCKDAHNDPAYHREAADEIGCHAWIAYYHPDIVCALAPWVRREHVVRTWHSVDPHAIPASFNRNRSRDCLLSGAINRDLYPLRWRLKQNTAAIGASYLAHPGYHARGAKTPEFLSILSRYRVAICTASIFGYALRKIIEATACGCRVITDLPPDEVMPAIDQNLIRVHPDIELPELAEIVRDAVGLWDADRQCEFSRAAVEWYDWRRRGRELAEAIEGTRTNY